MLFLKQSTLSRRLLLPDSIVALGTGISKQILCWSDKRKDRGTPVSSSLREQFKKSRGGIIPPAEISGLALCFLLKLAVQHLNQMAGAKWFINAGVSPQLQRFHHFLFLANGCNHHNGNMFCFRILFSGG